MAVLLADEPAFERAKNAQAHRPDQRECEGKVYPDRRMHGELEPHKQNHADHADHAHDEEGGAISRICKTVIQFALGAGVTDGQITFEQRAFAATRAAATDAGF